MLSPFTHLPFKRPLFASVFRLFACIWYTDFLLPGRDFSGRLFGALCAAFKSQRWAEFWFDCVRTPGWHGAIYQCHSGSHGITVSVSISVCQLVSLTGIYVCEAYTIWPWPCISPVSHTSVSRCLCVSVCIVSPNPQILWYVGGISTIFPGHCCLCLARCVCKFLHREGDKHTRAASRIYKPRHMAAHTLYGDKFTAANSSKCWLSPAPTLFVLCVWAEPVEYSAVQC